MKKQISILLAGIALTAAPALAQSINVTTTGVGIGTTTPASQLHVKDPFGTFTAEINLARFDYYNGRSLNILGPLVDDPNTPFTIQTNNALQFRIDQTNALIIDAAGNTTTPGSATVGSLIVGSSTLFSVGSFTSSEQSIPGNGVTLTVAHGLGGVPKFTSISLRCKTAEYGWAVNDEILLSSILMVSNNHGATTAVNGTNFKMIQYGNIYIHGITVAGPVAITATNWRLVFRAWR